MLRNPNIKKIKTPALVVMGEEDVSAHLTKRGAEWHADPYTLSSRPKSLLSFVGAGHLFGGVRGYGALETGGEESVEMVAVVQIDLDVFEECVVSW